MIHKNISQNNWSHGDPRGVINPDVVLNLRDVPHIRSHKSERSITVCARKNFKCHKSLCNQTQDDMRPLDQREYKYISRDCWSYQLHIMNLEVILNADLSFRLVIKDASAFQEHIFSSAWCRRLISLFVKSRLPRFSHPAHVQLVLIPCVQRSNAGRK